MSSFTVFGRFLDRRTQRKGMDANRRALATMSDADLADIGAKRYHADQIGYVRPFK